MLYAEHPWGGGEGLAPFPFQVWREERRWKVTEPHVIGHSLFRFTLLFVCLWQDVWLGWGQACKWGLGWDFRHGLGSRWTEVWDRLSDKTYFGNGVWDEVCHGWWASCNWGPPLYCRDPFCVFHQSVSGPRTL